MRNQFTKLFLFFKIKFQTNKCIFCLEVQDSDAAICAHRLTQVQAVGSLIEDETSQTTVRNLYIFFFLTLMVPYSI